MKKRGFFDALLLTLSATILVIGGVGLCVFPAPRYSAQENRLLQDNIADMRKKKAIDFEATCKAVSECKLSPSARRSLVLKIVDKVVLTRTDKGKGKSNYAINMQIYFK